MQRAAAAAAAAAATTAAVATTTTENEIHHVESSLTEKTLLTSSSSSSSSLTDDDDDLALLDNDMSSSQRQQLLKGRGATITIPYTISLPLLVMIDMLGVSLVVPLLSSRYYQLAGVTSPIQREWLSSIYSATQIIGGMTIGTLADSQILSRRTILLLSFVGSAFAYSLITVQGSGLTAIVISRVTVGLVKQTMTVTSSILAHSTHEKERATHMGRLTASVTVAWIVGPSAGAYLFSHVGTYTPIYVSCFLFLLNTLIVLFCLPFQEEEEEEEEHHHDTKVINKTKQQQQQQQQQQSAMGRILHHFQSCFRGGGSSTSTNNNLLLASTVIALLLFQWVFKTTSYKNISTYYETLYGTQPHQRGYLESYQAALSFVVQSFLIKPILHYLGGEINAACFASLLMTIVTFAEIKVNFQQYLILICPLVGIAIAILRVSLKSLVSKVAPKESLSSVFATIDILQNIAMVTVPFYRTILFRVTQPTNDDDNNNSSSSSNVLATTTTTTTTTTVDPDPKQWLIASGLHWMVATAAFSYLLLLQQNRVVGKDRRGANSKEDKLVEEEEVKPPSTNTKIKTS